MPATRVKMAALARTQSTDTVALVTMDTWAPTVRLVSRGQIFYFLRRGHYYLTKLCPHFSYDAVFLDMLYCFSLLKMCTTHVTAMSLRRVV